MSGFIENMGSGIPIVSCTKAVYRNGYYVPNRPATTKWGMKCAISAPIKYAPEHKRTPTRSNTDPLLSRRGWGEYYL